MFCLLDLIFNAIRGKQTGDILKMSSALKTELFILSLVGLHAETDLRAEGATKLYAVDASSWGWAFGHAAVPSAFSVELCRHSLQRGAWTRTLSTADVWLRENRLLQKHQELPEGQILEEKALFVDIAQAFQFSVDVAKAYTKNMHINVSELISLLAAETHLGTHNNDLSHALRSVVLGDSQVAAGAVAKGRSSSPELNAYLKQ